jgi:hypothetical protein
VTRRAEWAADELLRRRPFEMVTADLVGQGWPADAAVQIVEVAREATRRDRGVRTRDDVARGVARRYARSVRLVRWLVVIGIVAVVIAVAMFMRGKAGLTTVRFSFLPTQFAPPARRGYRARCAGRASGLRQ